MTARADLAPGSLIAAADFPNDAWGGTASTGATCDGAAVFGAVAASER